MSAARPLLIPDTSVVAKWLLASEHGADDALALREAYLRGEVLLALPELVLYELANVFQLSGDLDLELAGQFLAQLMRLGCPVVAPDPDHLMRCMELGRRTGLSGYDDAFATLAEDTGGIWVTADEEALRRLPHGFPALSLRNWASACP